MLCDSALESTLIVLLLSVVLIQEVPVLGLSVIKGRDLLLLALVICGLEVGSAWHGSS